MLSSSPPQSRQTARPIVELRVAVADVNGSVHELAPLPLLGRVGEIRAKGLKDGSEVDREAHAVRRVLPVVDAVWLHFAGQPGRGVLRDPVDREIR